MALELVTSGNLLPNGSFRIQWIGGQGMITVETSEDLLNWESVVQEEAVSWIKSYADPTASTAAQRFFRLRSGP